jgi:micrococcal nuclease
MGAGPKPVPVAGGAAAGFSAAAVERVVDGDTAIFALSGGVRERVRFIGVNTPESTTKHEPGGEQASAYTKRVLTPGRGVLLERDAEERDRYGRLLAYVWLEAPTAISDAEIRAKMLNAQLALDGYAQQMTIPPNVKHADDFRRYVAEARNAQRGLWGPGAGY